MAPYVGPLERKSDRTLPHHVERVVLLGYMCCGKSSVAEALARRLEWNFIDYDVEIEKREGRAVREIIDAAGEEFFRELEAALTEEMADQPFVVLAPGGGWITRPELLDVLGDGTLSAWLQVTPEETVRRLNQDTIDRPFKNSPDALSRVAEMQAEREPLYRLADLRVPADIRTTEEIAFEIEQVVRARGTGRRR